METTYSEMSCNVRYLARFMALVPLGNVAERVKASLLWRQSDHNSVI